MADAEKTSSPLPPYVSFPTFKTLVKSFQEHDIPSRIDRTVLPTFSGSIAGQLIPALRFLRLIGPQNQPTNHLQRLVSVYGSDMWPEALRTILDEAYTPLASINLQNAAPSQFDECFSKAYPGAENVIRKSKTFYLAAATEAKIPISPYIMRNKKPRSGPTKKRAAKNGAQKGEAVNPPPPFNPPPPPSDRKLSEQLLMVLDDVALDEQIKDAVLKLLPYLRQKGK